jgi:tRNA nucleotidyltransferase/poly(A) polymerase
LKTERQDQKINDTDEYEVSDFEAELIAEFKKPLTSYPRMHGRLCGLQDALFEKEHFSNVKPYLVGGAVREIVRGNPDKIKDWDFSIEAESFEQMEAWINFQGFEIFVKTPQYFTIRARASKSFYFAGMDMSGRTFDFALCRTDGEYSDGRRPDTVDVANLEADLSRREFTMNAMAMGSDGKIIDLHGGQEDIKNGLIKLVGGVERLREDPLRMLRAMRFSIQLGFYIDDEIWGFLYDPSNAFLLEKVDTNRIRDELTKCFKMNTVKTLLILQSLYAIRDYIFEHTPIWLEPTVKGK